MLWRDHLESGVCCCVLQSYRSAREGENEDFKSTMLNSYVEHDRRLCTLKVVAGDNELGESKVEFKESIAKTR